MSLSESFSTLESLNFNNLSLMTLPVDSDESGQQKQVPGACFSKVKPTPVDKPSLVSVSLPALNLLDIKESETLRKDFVDYFSGNKILPGSETAAHCYCGHQFGYFSGQLGDGAAMYLGEIINKKGERWEIQLKGAGQTPYSRGSDGRKVLRSSIREFLCSEAMYHLGIPTTRAGSCVTSDTKVLRDIFYDGNPKQEQCTLVLRIAPTFLRFGSFEIFKPTDPETGRRGPSVERTDILIKLLDYTIQNFYPEIWNNWCQDKTLMYVEFYKEVVRRTARLVAEWQCVGWCHGVLNTDNMSIVGVTIDYGPFGFMEKYDPDFICNASDDGGRYKYINQPEMCRWNCLKLAEAIQGAVPLSETQPHLELFDVEFDKHYLCKMRQKFGLTKAMPHDSELILEFFESLKQTSADFTNCFYYLSHFPLPSSPQFVSRKQEVIKYFVSQSSTLDELKKMNTPGSQNSQMTLYLMLAESRPDLIPMLSTKIPGVASLFRKKARLEELQKLSAEEISENATKIWSAWFDTFTSRLKEEEEGMNEESLQDLEDKRKKMMNSANPRFVLRNYIAQRAIALAEKGDYGEVRQVLKLLQSPYSDAETPELSCTSGDLVCHVDQLSYDGRPPDWTLDLRVT